MWSGKLPTFTVEKIYYKYKEIQQWHKNTLKKSKF